MLPQPESYVFSHIQKVKQRRVLEYHPYMFTDLIPFLFRQMGNILSFDKDISPCGGQQSYQDLQNGTFSCSGRPDHRHGLPFFNLQIDTLQYLFLAKSQLQISQGNNRFSHNASLICLRTTKPSENNPK